MRNRIYLETHITDEPEESASVRQILIRRVHAFLLASGWSFTTFGSRFGNNPMFVRRLVEGRKLSLQTVDRVEQAMKQYVSEEQEAMTPATWIQQPMSSWSWRDIPVLGEPHL